MLFGFGKRVTAALASQIRYGSWGKHSSKLKPAWLKLNAYNTWLRVLGAGHA